MSKRYQKGQKFGVPASSVAGQTMHLVGSEAADTVKLNIMSEVIGSSLVSQPLQWPVKPCTL